MMIIIQAVTWCFRRTTSHNGVCIILLFAASLRRNINSNIYIFFTPIYLQPTSSHVQSHISRCCSSEYCLYFGQHYCMEITILHHQ